MRRLDIRHQQATNNCKLAANKATKVNAIQFGSRLTHKELQIR